MPVKVKELIKLVTEAEKLLVKAGQNDPLTRVTTLRGIYYGTTWSLDYKTEKSKVRSAGFYAFTGGQDPIDPRKILGDKLFTALQKAQDVIDSGVKLDFGHLLIGVDARKREVARTFDIPTMGGTGLEIVTWLGDLGGGAANLALKRLTNPKLSVQHVFNDAGTDYGTASNLEGDIAAYLIALNTPIPNEPFIPTSIARELEKYFPLNDRTLWKKRAFLFLTAMGGKFQETQLLNQQELVRKLAARIQDFSVYYFIQRYVLGESVDNKKTSVACTILPGIAMEVSATFIRALIFCVANPGKLLSGRPPWPVINAPAKQCDIGLLRKIITANNIADKAKEYEAATAKAMKDMLERLHF